MNIDAITKVLKGGGLVVMPTDTVYGILGDSTNYETVKKAYEVKNRDYSKPMILLVSCYEMLEEYVEDILDLEKDLMNYYWPGELTILLKRNKNVLDIVTSGGELVGVRIPNDKNILRIIDEVGKPLISTSANISSKDTITSINLLEKSIVDNIDYIYDGGEVKKRASTIVRVIDDMVVVLRDGGLKESIEDRYRFNS